MTKPKRSRANRGNPVLAIRCPRSLKLGVAQAARELELTSGQLVRAALVLFLHRRGEGK